MEEHTQLSSGIYDLQVWLSQYHWYFLIAILICAVVLTIYALRLTKKQ